MASFNSVTLMGRLTRDPEMKKTSTGKTVTSFSLAVDRFGKDAGTDFFNCTAWEKVGDYLAQYSKKGALVLVDGRLKQDTWEQDGQKRSSVSITAFNAEIVDSGGDKSQAKDDTKAEEVDDIPTAEEVDNLDKINIEDIPY